MAGPHFEIRGRGFVDGTVLVDGNPFPWEIYGITWHIDGTTGWPRVTFEVGAERVTIDQHWPDSHEEVES